MRGCFPYTGETDSILFYSILSYSIIFALRRGARWALTVVFMVHDELPQADSRFQAVASGFKRGQGAAFRRHCVRAQTTEAYSYCRHGWAAWMQGNLESDVRLIRDMK